MNRILTRAGEGLIVGVMVAIVGSLTGILWNEYMKTRDALNDARETLVTQTTGWNEAQAKWNETQTQINDTVNEVVLKFIEQQDELNKGIRQTLVGLKKAIESVALSSVGAGSPGGTYDVPEIKMLPTRPGGKASAPTLNKLEDLKKERKKYQDEQIQIQQQLLPSAN